MAEAAAILQSMGVINGFEDGTFRPEQVLTRAQFCKLAVTILGQEAAVQSQSSRSLFSDVTAGSWYAGYVNLAYGKGLVNGYGNGCFGPEDSMSFAQAVTILLRMLGYTDAQVGTLWPRDQITYASRLGLSEGVSCSANDPITRGEATLLFRNLLETDTASGKAFYMTCCVSYSADVLILSNAAEAEDGTSGCVKLLSGNGVSCMKQSISLPDRFVGEKGTLLLDESGKVRGFLPDPDSTHTQIVVKSAISEKMIAEDGSAYETATGCNLLQNETRYSWANGYTRVKTGSTVTLYFNAAGKAELVWASGADSSLTAVAPYASSAKNLRYFKETLGLSGEVTLYKNGEAVSASEIAQNDVATADKLTNALFLSDRQVTGVIESMSPSAGNVTKVTLSGGNYAVLSRASGSFAGLSVGDRVTLFLTDALEVAAVSENLSVTEQVGVLQRGGSGYTVTLPGGMTLSGSAAKSVEEKYIGSLVRVSASGTGKLYLNPISANYSGGALCISQRAVGDVPLAPGAAIYEWAGSGCVTEISLSDVNWMDSIPASSISYVHRNAQGQADLVLLKDVTRNGDTYGIAARGSKNGTLNKISTITVTNADGNTAALTGGGNTADSAMVGVAASGANAAISVITLTSASVNRDDFSGTDAVLVQGFLFSIAEDVQVYNESSETWFADSPDSGTALEQALAYSDTLTIYYDRMPEQGGRIRIVKVS